MLLRKKIRSHPHGVLLAIGILFFFCIPAMVHAQNSLPAMYPVTQDSTLIVLNNTQWQLLADERQAFSIEQVSSLPLSQRFHADNPEHAETHYQSRCWWFRTALKNLMDKEAHLLLDGGDFVTIEFYISGNNRNWKKMQTGFFRPGSLKDGLKRINLVPITIRPGDSLIIYKKVIFRSGVNIPISFYWNIGSSSQKFSELSDGEDYRKTVADSILFGICLFLALLNLMFFLIISGREYLYFFIFVLAEGLSVFWVELYGTVLPDHATVVTWIQFYSVLGGNFFIVLFFRHFLQIRAHYPLLDRFLMLTLFPIYFAAILFCTLSAFYIQPVFASLGLIAWGLQYLPILLIFVCLLLFLRSRDRQVRLIVIGAIPAVFCWSVLGPINFVNGYYTFSTGLSEWAYAWWNIIEAIAMAWFAFFFGWILLLRFTDLRKAIVQKNLEKELLEKQKEIEKNQLIAQQNTELEKQVEQRTSELTQSLSDLKATQKQLVQSEKMASLGELTAGIAHEIQNPLNFVNNFAGVSVELIDEMTEAFASGNPQLATEIAQDLKENLEKINHHGQRADGIVKGMLQHSRNTGGQKEPTDINALCDEYLRLAYHGYRAKDKSFNASFETDFDVSLGKINVQPQELGRVILNLINNAFYAVNERKKQGAAGYEPKLIVTTEALPDKIKITVSDNGTGIPAAVVNKIFQPFFTTKPTGQGTGLGLSLSYDIVKAHGGELEVVSKVQEGTTFIIQLPSA